MSVLKELTTLTKTEYIMSDNEGKSSSFAFYAFLQIYKYFHHDGDQLKGITLSVVADRLYPNERSISTDSKTSLFVTWKKKRSKIHIDDPYALRGCIGTFAKLPIKEGLEKYSLIAALEDSRFPPIAAHELPKLKCSCNILQNFKVIYDGKAKRGDINNWELGTHGIELKFKDPHSKSHFSATFLPDVMTEQEWDKEDTFLNLIEKSGYWGNAKDVLNNYQDYFLEVIRYEGVKSSITYEEFLEQLNSLLN
ncbi:hypothetical protein Kpol_1043p52 [Vanderwaltozyma polyspora DSM 70294]|uniref:AMMECR1 domain-containing protein n=1 Tax=Vanderwaltozyma polyspora (strain ATCC 22028 / DSM 70294 / BCRC 21397 / CBS 2163 / NBRC 10782 / NRRL Y-8283 / UCD 57-17) TaxID=436907 RepID=A7TIS0_VANPO|nr:uncharacterized protein Kpol_1043p52 [Vanderwaltozyma polyspora DSM 70294]EDO17862.1 hypothetical protein Kpol_1043p52 [Vanderwaltozyma polyspora DSM 70294]